MQKSLFTWFVNSHIKKLGAECQLINNIFLSHNIYYGIYFFIINLSQKRDHHNLVLHWKDRVLIAHHNHIQDQGA